MARTLVIKNADFSANKVTTVVFNDKECTGITLNADTLSIKKVGNTGTLTATVTPVDTTDAIIWQSSDNNVATVLGGVVTAVGIGEATITAVCGSHSASCAVTVTHIAELSFTLNKVLVIPSGDDKTYFQGGNLSNSAYAYSEIGTKKLYYGSASAGQYPLVIPAGAEKIIITCAGFKVKGFWASSTTATQSASTQCYVYPVDDFGTYGAEGSRVVTIPDRSEGTYANMDAVVFDFEYQNGTITEEAVNAIVVEFAA